MTQSTPTRRWRTATRSTPTRRRVLRTGAVLAGAGVLGTLATGSAAANPGKPDFSPGIYADGDPWGTKGTTTLPPPTDHTVHSFDPLIFVYTGNGLAQFPVAEAAPGNPAYNGGRWFSKRSRVLDWAEYESRAPLTSYQDVLDAVDDGVLGEFEDGAPDFGDGPVRPASFQCPLLPVKES